MNAPCLAPIFDDATLRTTYNSASKRSLPTWSQSKLFGCTDINFETITVWPLRTLTEIKKLRKWTFSSTDIAIGVFYHRILILFSSEKMSMWASNSFYFQLPSSPFSRQANIQRETEKERTRNQSYNCKSVPLWVLLRESTSPSQDQARTHSDGARRRASYNSKPCSTRDWSRGASS